MRAGLFGLDELAALPLIGAALRGRPADYPDSTRAPDPDGGGAPDDRRHGRRRDGRDAPPRTPSLAPRSADDVRAAADAVVAFSRDMAEDRRRSRDFLCTRMYRHWQGQPHPQPGAAGWPRCSSCSWPSRDVLPPSWRARAGGRDEAGRARVVCDYIAGMTDRYAIEEHRRLTDPNIPG